MSDEAMDIDEAAEGGFFWNGKKLHPFSWEHEVAFEQFVIPGAAHYNAQLLLWMLNQSSHLIEELQGAPESVRPLVKEFAIGNGLKLGSKKMKLCNELCGRILEQARASEAEPELEGGSSGPK